MADIRDTFAANVRKYRKAARLSQEKLAELAGLHRTYIGGIEQRRVNVSLKNIGKIAGALNVEPSVLFITPDHDEGPEPIRRRAPVENERERTDEPEHSEYALVRLDDEQAPPRPIEVAYEDLTVQILHNLILSGHHGNDLSMRYAEVHDEVIAFLSR